MDTYTISYEQNNGEYIGDITIACSRITRDLYDPNRTLIINGATITFAGNIVEIIKL